MSKFNRCLWASWLAIVSVGCGATGGGAATDDRGSGGSSAAGEIHAEGAAKPVVVLSPGGKPSAAIDPATVAIPDALTWTSDGRLAVISGKSGAVRQAADTAAMSGARDLVYDPWQKRAVVYEQDDQAEGGEIASYALVPGPSGPVLAPRLHESWVDGDLRFLASQLGIVAFEESYGTWWKLFFSDEESVLSVAAPLPASAWISPTASGVSIRTLGAVPGLPLIRRSAEAQWTALSAPLSASLGISPAGAAPTARLMPAPARGEAMLFDVVGSALSIRLVSGASPGPAVLLPLGAGGLRVEQALPVDGGEVALLLLSGESRVLAVEVNAAGGVSSSASLALPGAVRQETKFFSHELTMLGARRALAATSAGVHAVLLGRDAGGVHLSLDPSFAGSALRGPVEALPIKPL